MFETMNTFADLADAITSANAIVAIMATGDNCIEIPVTDKFVTDKFIGNHAGSEWLGQHGLAGYVRDEKVCIVGTRPDDD